MLMDTILIKQEIPDIEEFVKLDFEKQKEIYQNLIRPHNPYTLPFWAERLLTAIENKKPMALYAINILNIFYLRYMNCK